MFLSNVVHQGSQLILFSLWSPTQTTKTLLTLGSDDTASIFCFPLGLCAFALEKQFHVAIFPLFKHLMFLSYVSVFPLLLLNNEDGRNGKLSF